MPGTDQVVETPKLQSIFSSPDLSKGLSIRDSMNQIDMISMAALNVLKNTIKRCFELIWNSDTYTAQDVCDMYGTGALKLFIASAQVQGLIKTLDPNYVVLEAPADVTINKDGTVTITAKKAQ
jgi:hypothetical protein